MPNSSKEMRLRDVAIGSRSELNEAIYQREKADLVIAELHLEQSRLQNVITMRDVEIAAIRQSHTWKIGSLVLAPLHWIKRSAR
jgi:hypothetical protein